MGFARHVGYETIRSARFNYWEPSFGYTKGKHGGLVYHARIDELDLNIVVIEIDRYSNRRLRHDFYFGTFQGKDSRHCETDEELEEFFSKIDKIANRRHRIAGRELEVAIKNAIKEAVKNS